MFSKRIFVARAEPASSSSTSSTTSSATHTSKTTPWTPKTKTILAILAIIASAITLGIMIALLIYAIQKLKCRKKEQEHAKEIERLNIQIMRDKVDEDMITMDTISLDEARGLRPPPSPMRFVEPVSVWESDDESGPGVAKRTKALLKKGLKGRERGRGRRSGGSGHFDSGAGDGKESWVNVKL